MVTATPSKPLTHAVSWWPHFWKSREKVTCKDCASEVQRRAYERQIKWRARAAAFVNKHAPFVTFVDGRGQDWEAR